MSVPQFPLHPERIPAQHTHTAGFLRWQRYERPGIMRKAQRNAFLKSLVDLKLWWNIVKILTVPVVAALIVAWLITGIMAPNVMLTFTLKTYLVGGSIASCVVFSLYVDLWTAKVKTRSDWVLIRFVGAVSGALIGLTGIFISLIPA
jgi:hypothetical protein